MRPPIALLGSVAAGLALAGLTALPVAAQPESAQQESLAGFYLSSDDLALAETGVIEPIAEYLVIAEAAGGMTLEAGYQHLVADTRALAEFVPWSVVSFGAAVSDLGRLDLANGRRVALEGPLEVIDGSLAWQTDLLAPTSHEPGRFESVGDVDPRPSPFQTAALGAGDALARLIFTLEGDSLVVTTPDEASHRFQRADPLLYRYAGLLISHAGLPYLTARDCAVRLAAPLARGAPMAFSEATLAAHGDALAGEAGAQATWTGMQARGVGELAQIFFKSALTAEIGLAETYEKEMDRGGGLQFLAERSAEPEADNPEWGLRLALIGEFHDFESARALPTGEPSLVLSRALEEGEARYRADPWSVTAPVVNEHIGDGWVDQVVALVARECAGG